MNIVSQVQLLSDRTLKPRLRVGIAGFLAETSKPAEAVPLLRTLAAETTLHLDVRKAIIKTLGKLGYDKATAEVLVKLVNEDKQVHDEAACALWSVSRRARVRAIKDPLTDEVKIVEVGSHQHA